MYAGFDGSLSSLSSCARCLSRGVCTWRFEDGPGLGLTPEPVLGGGGDGDVEAMMVVVQCSKQV